MKKVKLPLIYLAFFFIVGCSDDEAYDNIDGGTPPETEEIPEPAFSVSSKDIQIFEGTEIAIRLKEDLTRYYEYNLNKSLAASFILDWNYDSIIWNIDNIMRKKSANGHNIISMTQSFALPGEYKLYVDGYREGKVYSTDTTIINVYEPRDFLSIRWGDDNTKKEYYNFINSVNNFFLNLKYYSEPVPHALLTYSPRSYGRDEEEKYLANIKSSRKYLYDYITELYGAHAFNFDGDDITQGALENEYNARFKIPLDAISSKSLPKIPLTIWETNSTYIALIAIVYPESPEYTYYEIIAEPR